MLDAVPADRLEVLVVVDNATDSLSSNPPNVIPEWTGLLTGGRMRVVAGACICCAHHGLSLLITANAGGEKHTVLFDAGPEGEIFHRNTRILGIDFAAVDAVVLSHGHWDHAGGLIAALQAISGARGAGQTPCYVHPGMFVERGAQRPGGEFLPFESVPEPAHLERAGARVVNTREPQSAVGGFFYVSGEIPRVTSYETGMPGHVRRSADGIGWEPDPLIMDERFLAVHVKDKGLVVFSACSHAGVVNVLKHARSVFPDVPLYGLVGGLHLSGSTEKVIPETVRDLREFGLKLLAPGHCTGWRAVSAMARVLGEELVPTAVGKQYIV